MHFNSLVTGDNTKVQTNNKLIIDKGETRYNDCFPLCQLSVSALLINEHDTKLKNPSCF